MDFHNNKLIGKLNSNVINAFCEFATFYLLGTFPSNFKSLIKLSGLSLYNNSMSGKISTSIMIINYYVYLGYISMHLWLSY